MAFQESDVDLALALSLQEEYDCAVVSKTAGTTRSQGLGIVDEHWELADPNPNIHQLFVQYDSMFFWSKLTANGVAVDWSKRMTLCAGVCSYEGRAGFCSIRLSFPLLKLRPRKDLVETLLHEMIHAFLFVTHNNKDHDGHGPEFLSHMHRINKASGAKITVFHTFNNEVRQYRQHWWKCDGPCQKRPPFYGVVMRAMNRPPSSRDLWWDKHQRTCGGRYVKIKEPEGYGKKGKGQGSGRGNKDIRELIGAQGRKQSSSQKESSEGEGFVLGTRTDTKEGRVSGSRAKGKDSGRGNKDIRELLGGRKKGESSEPSSRKEPIEGQGFVLGARTDASEGRKKGKSSGPPSGAFEGQGIVLGTGGLQERKKSSEQASQQSSVESSRTGGKKRSGRADDLRAKMLEAAEQRRARNEEKGMSRGVKRDVTSGRDSRKHPTAAKKPRMSDCIVITDVEDSTLVVEDSVQWLDSFEAEASPPSPLPAEDSTPTVEDSQSVQVLDSFEAETSPPSPLFVKDSTPTVEDSQSVQVLDSFEAETSPSSVKDSTPIVEDSRSVQVLDLTEAEASPPSPLPAAEQQEWYWHMEDYKTCPVCGMANIPSAIINIHVSLCLEAEEELKVILDDDDL